MENNNMKLEELIQQYEESYIRILDLFGTNGWDYIEIYRTDKWFHQYDAMVYIEDGDEYRFDSCKKIGEDVQGYALFYVQDNGNTFYAIFKIENRLTEEEIEELL